VQICSQRYPAPFSANREKQHHSKYTSLRGSTQTDIQAPDFPLNPQTQSDRFWREKRHFCPLSRIKSKKKERHGMKSWARLPVAKSKKTARPRVRSRGPKHTLRRWAFPAACDAAFIPVEPWI
jgi:hypothetical protein